MALGNSRTSVLLIEDSEEVQNLVRQTLLPIQANVVIVASCREARLAMEKNQFSVFIIDLSLPDGDGLELLSTAREMPQYRKTPILILSSHQDVARKVSAFSMGADDYITKPFNLLEFKARIGAQIRKVEMEEIQNDSFQAGPFSFEIQKQLVRLQGQQEALHLTPIEFRILAQLARRPEVIFSRNQILDHVWGDSISVTDRTVDSHIYSLRKKLGPWGKCIQSVPGEGYRLHM